MTDERAPIALFAYRRPEHLARCLASLAANPEARQTALVIYCDGPKSAADAKLVATTRDVARAAEGFTSVRVIASDVNRGLAASVISGVSEVLEWSDSVIVVEDDLVVSEDFLAYMNQGLELYRDEPKVVSIHGFLPRVREALPQSFFLRGADCWGWATWRRGWNTFNPDGSDLLRQLRSANEVDAFDFHGAYPYLEMLERQVRGEVDSWAIRWYASAFLAGQFTLHPGASLVTNIGMEGSGTHAGQHQGLNSTTHRLSLPLHRTPVVENTQARAAVGDALRGRVRTWNGITSRLSRSRKRKG